MQANPSLFTAKVECPAILTMDNKRLQEAAQDIWKIFDGDIDQEEKEEILEPFKFVFHNIKDMWTFCDEIMDNRHFIAYCECREEK